MRLPNTNTGVTSLSVSTHHIAATANRMKDHHNKKALKSQQNSKIGKYLTFTTMTASLGSIYITNSPDIMCVGMTIATALSLFVDQDDEASEDATKMCKKWAELEAQASVCNQAPSVPSEKLVSRYLELSKEDADC